MPLLLPRAYKVKLLAQAVLRSLCNFLPFEVHKNDYFIAGNRVPELVPAYVIHYSPFHMACVCSKSQVAGATFILVPCTQTKKRCSGKTQWRSASCAEQVPPIATPHTYPMTLLHTGPTCTNSVATLCNRDTTPLLRSTAIGEWKCATVECLWDFGICWILEMEVVVAHCLVRLHNPWRIEHPNGISCNTPIGSGSPKQKSVLWVPLFFVRLCSCEGMEGWRHVLWCLALNARPEPMAGEYC